MEERYNWSKMASKNTAFTQMRTTVIKRGHHLRFNEVPRPFTASQGASVFPDGMVQHLYHSAVENVVHLKSKECGDMQGLNERLASYIENVRYLEAQNKELLAHNERLKRKKEYDSSELKVLYERELEECKTVINELSTEKVQTDAKVVGLEERLEAEKKEKEDLEKQNGDLKHRIDRLNSHIGDYDGELTNLRMKVEFMESEIDKMKASNKRIRDDNFRLQSDLDVETVKRLTAENDFQAANEHYQFQMKVQDTEISELRILIDSEKSVDMSGIWKGELSKAVNEIQAEYDRLLEEVKVEIEQRMNLQLQKIQSSVNRDTLELKQAKDENKLLKSRLEMMGPRMSDLEAEVAKYKVHAQIAYEQKARLEQDYNAEVKKLQDSIKDYEKRIEAIIEELKVLQNAKLSLEVEITMYRKLLESEENKLVSSRNIEDTSLVEIRERKSHLVRQQTKYDEIQGNVKILKTCRSSVSITEAALDGTFVTLENNGKTKLDLTGWKILRENESGKITSEYVFGDVTLEAGKNMTLFTDSSEQSQTSDGDMSSGFYSWGAGTGEFKLFGKDAKEVKASLSMDFRMEETRDVRNN